jgi:hypothetical protein
MGEKSRAEFCTRGELPSGGFLTAPGRSFLGCRKGGALQGAKKSLNAVILSPLAVILSAVKNLALSVFKAIRDSSSPATPLQKLDA